MKPARAAAPAAVAVVLAVTSLLAGCGSTAKEAPAAKGSSATQATDAPAAFESPEGRFRASFPAPPEQSERSSGDGASAVVIHRFRAVDNRVGAYFLVSYYDAPPGELIGKGKEVTDAAPARNAAADGGKLIDTRAIRFGGLASAIEFHVQTADGYYWSRHLLVGGRLYEITVGEKSAGRELFDRFAGSFALTQPPLAAAEAASFFAAAEPMCAEVFGALPAFGPDQRADGITALSKAYETLVAKLAVVPAPPSEQGQGAAWLDAYRRASTTGLRLADLLRAGNPQATTLSELIKPDLGFITSVAKSKNAPTCGRT